jgi:hypothetical protein
VEIEAAEIYRMVIHDQQLAMVPPVVTQRVAPAPAVKPFHTDPALPEEALQPLRGPEQRAGGVEMGEHLNALLRLGRERLREAPTDLVRREDIAFETYTPPCGCDRCQHRIV